MPRPRRRWLWTLLGGFFLGGVVIVCLILAPPFQSWLLRKVLATRPDWGLEVQRIGAGPTGVDANGVEFTWAGFEASVDAIAVRVSPARILIGRELHIERVEARRIRLTLMPRENASTVPGGGASPLGDVSSVRGNASSAPFNGVLHLFQSPIPWALDEVNVDGEIVVREAGALRREGEFSLRKGGTSATAPGEFAYDFTVNSGLLNPGLEQRLSSTGKVRISQTPARGIDHIGIEGDLRLPGNGKRPPSVGHFAADVTATPTGEAYVAHLSLGPASTVDLDATMDEAHATLAGHVRIRADQQVAARLAGERLTTACERLPSATINGDLAFTLNTRNGDVDATIAGDLDARDWGKIMPQLAGIGALNGRLEAALSRRGGEFLLNHLSAVLRGNDSPALASLAVTRAFDPSKPPSGPLATLKIEHLPLEWLNPFLASSGLQLGAADFTAAWDLTSDGGSVVRLEPTEFATLGPITVSGPEVTGFPRLPLLKLSFRPLLVASSTRVWVTLDDFSAISPAGDRLEGRSVFSRDTTDGKLSAAGSLRGVLPTFFTSPDGLPPFALNASWDAILDTAPAGSRLHMVALKLSAVRPPMLAEPATSAGQAAVAELATLELRRAFDFDLEGRVFDFSKDTPAGSASELFRLRFAGLPLAWLSRWLPGREVAGTLTAGESVLRPAAEGGCQFSTSVPWKLEGGAYGTAHRAATGGQPAAPFLTVGGRLSPGFLLRGDTFEMAAEEISLVFGKDECVSGRVGVSAALAEKRFAAELALDAELPELPHSRGTFGPLRAKLRAKGHTMTSLLVAVDTFDCSVGNASGSLLEVDARLPFIFGLSNSGSVVASTLSPLRLRVGSFPLAWLHPWNLAPGIDGSLAPTEFSLSALIDSFAVKTSSPVKVEGFSVRNAAGMEVIGDATVAFDAGLDGTLLCVTQPAVEMGYSGTARVSRAHVDVAGRRAIEFDLGVGFKGNDKVVLPDSIDLGSRIDFGALPDDLAAGLPEKGTLVTRINGDLLGAQPIEVRATLADLPAAGGNGPPPPLELTIIGKISHENVLTGSARLLLASAPRPTDAEFDVKLNLIEGGLNVESGLRSKYADAAALLSLARAFPAAGPRRAAGGALGPRGKPGSGAAPGSEAARSPGAEPLPSDAGPLPFWGALQGSFDLSIDTFDFAPYRINGLRGRLEADRRSLVLKELNGEMFAGRFGGELRIDHPPGNTTGEHSLTGDFHIEQFDSARVVQTVFPNQLATVDARIDVHATVASRGCSLAALLDTSVATFDVQGEKGVIRLTVPKAEEASTAAVFGGTVLLSPELRALGRLLKKLAEMPLDRLSIRGRRGETGEVTLDEFHFDSPEVRLLGNGRVRADAGEPLMNHPLELSVDLAAKDDLAVILGGMHLLKSKARSDGFRAMRDTFFLGGRAGAPDTAPLYDLLARAVNGSRGTWGFLMRKFQAQVKKREVPGLSASGPQKF